MSAFKLIAFLFFTTAISSCRWTLPKIETCQCTSSLIDERDNKKYEVIWIDIDGGNDHCKEGQCWMQENLNYDLMDCDIGNKYCYDSLNLYCEQFGGLYDFEATLQKDIREGARGICPEGWHIPSKQEYKELIEHVGILGSGLSLATGCCSTTNSSGFTALFAGYRKGGGGFSNHILDGGSIGARASFWTSTPEGDKMYGFLIYVNSDLTLANPIATSSRNHSISHSIRCICDQ